MAKKQTTAGELQQLKAQLKSGTPGRLYVFHGEETFLMNHYLTQLKKLLLEELTESFNYHRLNNETFDMLDIAKSEIEEQMKFVKENDVCRVMSYKGNVFGVEPPFFVELEVTETDPGFKGDTATNATKPAVLETGAEIKVPLFIDQGDVIRIDTRTGEYMERA